MIARDELHFVQQYWTIRHFLKSHKRVKCLAYDTSCEDAFESSRHRARDAILLLQLNLHLTR